MIRRVAFIVKNYRSIVSRTSRAISDKPDQQPTKETAQPVQPETPKTEEDPSTYEDYGDVKIRRGGRTIKVDESEHVGDSTVKKSINMLTVGLRIVWWGSVAYLGYSLYDYKTNPSKKPSNVVDEYFHEGAKYIDHSYRKLIDLFVKPPSDKLLPEIPKEFLPPGYVEPKTILINLSGTTVHSNYKLGKGRELIKRPGLDELIKHFAQRCEIIIFSDDDLFLITTLIPKLDPTGQRIYYALGSESMVVEGAKRVKDLKYINRDPKKIIVIESNPERLPKQPENGIFIPTFEGDPDDTELFKLLPFLEYLSNPAVRDVREELKKYGNFNPGEKFMQEIEKRKSAISRQRTGGFGGMLMTGGGRKQQQQS